VGRVELAHIKLWGATTPRKNPAIILYTLRPKIFAPFDFCASYLTIRLILKICENVKIIMIYLNIYDDKTCHSKVNNIFTIFNKTNGQI
jgi:hypothetical protein